MENAKKSKTTTGAALITMVLVTCLASSELVVSDDIEVRARDVALMKALLIGHAGAGCVPKGQPCDAQNPCCNFLYCTTPVKGTCVCNNEGQSCGFLELCCEGLFCSPSSKTCQKVTRSATLGGLFVT